MSAFTVTTCVRSRSGAESQRRREVSPVGSSDLPRGRSGRVRWLCDPLVGVGPLRFGAGPDDVGQALNGAVATVSVGTRERWFPGAGVAAYFSETGKLACVAVDALKGPQVTLEGTDLVGRPPSEVEEWFLEHARTRGTELRYSHEGNPGSAALGVVMRVQRAGDVVVSRPLFLTREWASAPWDHIPHSEWRTF